MWYEVDQAPSFTLLDAILITAQSYYRSSPQGEQSLLAKLDQQGGFPRVFEQIYRHTLQLAELAQGKRFIESSGLGSIPSGVGNQKKVQGDAGDEVRDGLQQLRQLRILIRSSASSVGAAGVESLRSTKTAEHAASCTRDLMGQFPSTPASGESHSQERAIAIRCRSSCQLVPLLIAFSTSTTAKRWIHQGHRRCEMSRNNVKFL